MKPFTRGDDIPLYADGFGYLLLAEKSISELNKRLKQNGVNDLEVEETRFRPNIYITGDMSYQYSSYTKGCYSRRTKLIGTTNF